MTEEQITEKKQIIEEENSEEKTTEEDTESKSSDVPSAEGKDSEDAEVKKERRLVVPGEVIISGDDYLPGEFTRKDGKDIIAKRYGLAETGGRVIKVIPLSGVFEPRRGNSVIGRVQDLTYSGWVIEIDGPYSAFLPIMESPRFINKDNLGDYANIGDVISAKILGVKRGSVDLTLKSRGLGKLEGGRIIKINPHKVPRVIGREGSMINLIKDESKTEITVGQNGYIWIKGDAEGEKKAEDAINLVCKEATSAGLTEIVEKFLKEGSK